MYPVYTCHLGCIWGGLPFFKFKPSFPCLSHPKWGLLEKYCSQLTQRHGMSNAPSVDYPFPLAHSSSESPMLSWYEWFSTGWSSSRARTKLWYCGLTTHLNLFQEPSRAGGVVNNFRHYVASVSTLKEDKQHGVQRVGGEKSTNECSRSKKHSSILCVISPSLHFSCIQ